MQTQYMNVSALNTAFPAESDGFFDNLDLSNRSDGLKAIYRQIFKENRDLEFFHNRAIDSAYLQGELTTRQFVRKLLCSEMYRDYILSVNSNYRFVALCFERVLGRIATPAEERTWSSLLATEGLDSFAEQLVNSDEYLDAFGEYKIPTRRSQNISSSHLGLPALPESASQKRYAGPGWLLQNQYMIVSPNWKGGQPPQIVLQLGRVFAIGGGIALAALLILTIAGALSTGF